MSFADWVSNGWLVAHKSSKQEIGNLLGIVARDRKDSQAKDVSDDWRFAIAYNAALQAATAWGHASCDPGEAVAWSVQRISDVPAKRPLWRLWPLSPIKFTVQQLNKSAPGSDGIRLMQ